MSRNFRHIFPYSTWILHSLPIEWCLFIAMNLFFSPLLLRFIQYMGMFVCWRVCVCVFNQTTALNSHAFFRFLLLDVVENTAHRQWNGKQMRESEVKKSAREKHKKGIKDVSVPLERVKKSTQMVISCSGSKFGCCHWNLWKMLGNLTFCLIFNII